MVLSWGPRTRTSGVILSFNSSLAALIALHYISNTKVQWMNLAPQSFLVQFYKTLKTNVSLHVLRYHGDERLQRCLYVFITRCHISSLLFYLSLIRVDDKTPTGLLVVYQLLMQVRARVTCSHVSNSMSARPTQHRCVLCDKTRWVRLVR